MPKPSSVKLNDPKRINREPQSTKLPSGWYILPAALIGLCMWIYAISFLVSFFRM